VELRHGYTLAHVNDLSVKAVRWQTWFQDANTADRLDLAWSAIVEHIYTSDQRPTSHEVILAGWAAISEDARKNHQTHGHNTHNRWAGTIPGFERYWSCTAPPTPSPETRVTERIALAQIWPQLHPAHRKVLAALAACEDYGLAAASLGISRAWFTSRLSAARKAFLKHWHEGESPSRPWGDDRRGIAPTNHHTITGRTIGHRRRRAQQRATRGLPPVAKTGAPSADLGISDAELARRYENGETIRQLATALDSSYSTIQRRLQAEGARLRPARPPARPAPRANLGITDTELARRYENGETTHQLAAALGASRSTIQRRLHAHGAHLRPPGQRPRTDSLSGQAP
jgi:DNA-directed RNA polymerase specialized sigma24 family protein